LHALRYCSNDKGITEDKQDKVQKGLKEIL